MVTRALWYLAPSRFLCSISCCFLHPPIHYTGINRKAMELSDLLYLRICAFPFPPRISPFSSHASILIFPCKAIPGFFLIPQASLAPHHLADPAVMLSLSQLVETGDLGSYLTASPFVALRLAPKRCSVHNFLISKWSLDNYVEDRGFGMAPYSFWNSC